MHFENIWPLLLQVLETPPHIPGQRRAYRLQVTHKQPTDATSTRKEHGRRRRCHDRRKGLQTRQRQRGEGAENGTLPEGVAQDVLDIVAWIQPFAHILSWLP